MTGTILRLPFPRRGWRPLPSLGPVSAGTLTDWSPVVATVGRAFFDILGIQPRFGRFDSRDFDAAEGGTTPVVITDRVWRVRFGGRQDIGGLSVSVGDRLYRVVGLSSEAFVYPATGPALGLHRTARGPGRHPHRIDVHGRTSSSRACREGKPLAFYQERFNVVARAGARELGSRRR